MLKNSRTDRIVYSFDKDLPPKKPHLSGSHDPCSRGVLLVARSGALEVAPAPHLSGAAPGCFRSVPIGVFGWWMMTLSSRQFRAGRQATNS